MTTITNEPTSEKPLLVARPTAPRPLTVDQARTQELERRGLHGAVVRSDGLRLVVELGHVRDFDALLDRVPSPVAVPKKCSRCEDRVADLCATCAREGT